MTLINNIYIIISTGSGSLAVTHIRNATAFLVYSTLTLRGIFSDASYWECPTYLS